MAIAVVVLAIGAAPAVAAQENALRTAPRSVVRPIAVVAPSPAAVVIRPAAVWIPVPAAGIKWMAPVPKPAAVRSARLR